MSYLRHLSHVTEVSRTGVSAVAHKVAETALDVFRVSCYRLLDSHGLPIEFSVDHRHNLLDALGECLELRALSRD